MLLRSTMTHHNLSTQDRFWLYVNRKGEDDCWEWTGGKDTFGYGMFTLKRGKANSLRAHRFSYEMVYGNIPSGMFVCHKCDNPGCVNPNHLFLGTAFDNNLDRDRKGRQVAYKGENHPSAKLNKHKIFEMKYKRKLYKYSYRKLGELFGVSASTTQRALNGITWSCLGNDYENT